MTTTPVQISDINDGLSYQLNNIVKLYKTAAPSTTVTNRALVTDFTKDLLPRLGIERYSVQAVEEIIGEYGPNGERVYKPVNDAHDQVRFVGYWGQEVANDGNRIFSSVTGDYVEITFLGTGLNFVTTRVGSRTVIYNVDGGGDVTLTNYDGTSTLLNGRNYTSNSVSPIVQNLSYGMHTVKVRANAAGSIQFAGYEIVTNSGTSPNVLQLTKGSSYIAGRKVNKLTSTVDSYNSNFETTLGTPGTRGGHVVIYQKSDGSIGKAIQYTDASSATLGSASHTNEEVIKTEYWRCFGYGRTDDFSEKNTNNSTTANLAFTLEDGTTTLTGSDVRAASYAGAPYEGPIFVTTSGFVEITFVGTGIDVIAQNDSNVRDWVLVSLDGANLGNYQPTAWTGLRRIPFASGLPYGTHVLKLGVTDGGEPGLDTIITYGPKKPSIPTGATEIADYFLMATYVSGTTAGLETIATGVLRKMGTREALYSGTWTNSVIQADTNIGGFQTETSTNTSFVEYTFYGTGFELRGRTNTGSTSLTLVQLQSLSTGGAMLDLQTTNYPGISGNNGTYGGYTFTQASGNLSSATSNNSGSGFWVRNLTLGAYKLKFVCGANLTFRPECLDVITPIHAPKNNGPYIRQNTLPIGSCAIRDSRVFGNTQVKTRKALVRAGSITTDTHSANAGNFQPLGQNVATFYLDKESDVEIVFDGMFLQTTAVSQQVTVRISCNGLGLSNQNGRTHTFIAAVNSDVCVGYKETQRLAAGYYTIVVYWHNNAAGQLTSQNGERVALTVNRLD